MAIEVNKVSRPKVEVNVKWCKGCGICVAFCPKNALALGDDGKVYVANPEACSGCRLCELRCPDFAVTVLGGERDERQSS